MLRWCIKKIMRTNVATKQIGLQIYILFSKYCHLFIIKVI